MKIGIGLIKHESNSFNPELTEIDDFKILRGAEIFNNEVLMKNSSMGGMVDFFARKNEEVELVPLVSAIPKYLGGLISFEAYREIKEIFFDKLRSSQNLDAICMDFHGSMTVEDGIDGEGDLLEGIREIIGPGNPVVCSLDLHGMVTKKMIKHGDGFVGYRTAPHVDKFETGNKAANLLYDALKNNYQLKTASVFLPLLVSGEMSETEKEPMKSLIKELENAENGSVLSASYFLGFPWVDVEFNHGAALVVGRKKEAAVQTALKLGERFWQEHKNFDFTTETHSMDQALKKARVSEKKPVYICDCGDNPGAGGSQNMTYTLHTMLKMELERALLGVIADKKACSYCFKKKHGSRVNLKLGRFNVEDPTPLEIEGTLKLTGTWKGVQAAVIELDGVEVVITSERTAMVDPDFFKELGIVLQDYDIVVLKGGYLAPKFQTYAAQVLFGLAPGYTNQIFEELNYKNLSRPIYPLDQNFEFNAQDYLFFS